MLKCICFWFRANHCPGLLPGHKEDLRNEVLSRLSYLRSFANVECHGSERSEDNYSLFRDPEIAQPVGICQRSSLRNSKLPDSMPRLLVESGDIRKTLSDHDTGSALGIAYLQTQIGEGDAAAALLSTPGEFESFNEQRAALQGIIGDVARDEINDEDVVALRLWPHSTGIFVSTARFDSVDDFQGKNIHTDDPYSVALFKNLGAVPVEQVESASVADKVIILPQGNFLPQSNLQFLDELKSGTVVPDYKLWAGVTMASFDWWLSLTAGEQRRLIGALEAAEEAAAEIVEEDTKQAIARLPELATLQTVSLRKFEETKKLRDAVSSSISEKTGVDAEPILRLHDHIKKLQQRPDRDTETNEPEQKGSLNRPARVFFATNRRFDSDEKRLVDKFANSQDPENVLRCGELKPAADRGSVGKVSGEVTLVKGSMIVQGECDCLKEISSAVHETGGKALIHVHGYANEFTDAVRTGLAFSRDAEREGVVVVWSWPSAGGHVRLYGLDTERIKTSEPIFDSFSHSLSESKGVRTVNFLAHSMGSLLLANLMRDNWIEQPSAVVLAAADVSRFFVKQAVEAAQSASVTSYVTEGDGALLISGGFYKDSRAGRADPLLLIDGMDTIDLTAYDRSWWSWFWLWVRSCLSLSCLPLSAATNHGHAFVEPEVVADLAELFKGKWTAASRGLKPHRIPGSNVDYYKIFPDGR